MCRVSTTMPSNKAKARAAEIRVVPTGISCDKADCSAYAAKFPACGIVKGGKDDEAKRKLIMNRDAAVKCVDFMVKHVDRAIEIWSRIEQLSKEEAVTVNEDFFNPQYKRIRNSSSR